MCVTPANTLAFLQPKTCMVWRLGCPVPEPSWCVTQARLNPAHKDTDFTPDFATYSDLPSGADVVGADELIASIQASQGKSIDFDKCIATPDFMRLLAGVGKILGPKGLMPNPKVCVRSRDPPDTSAAPSARLEPSWPCLAA